LNGNEKDYQKIIEIIKLFQTVKPFTERNRLAEIFAQYLRQKLPSVQDAWKFTKVLVKPISQHTQKEKVWLNGILKEMDYNRLNRKHYRRELQRKDPVGAIEAGAADDEFEQEQLRKKNLHFFTTPSFWSPGRLRAPNRSYFGLPPLPNPMNDPISPEPVVPGYRDIYGPKAPPPYLGIDSSEWARSDFNDPDGLFFDLSSAFQAKDLEKGEDSSGSPDEKGEPGEGVEGDNFGDVDYLSFNLYVSEDGTRTYEYFVNGKPVSKEKYKEAEKKIKPSSNERPLESGTSEGDFSASTRWLFGVDPNLGADRHLIPTHQGAEPDTLPDAAHHPWEDPFSGWRMPGGFDRFTQQSRPMGPGDLSGMPDEEHASFGAYVAGVRAGERILTYDFGGGLEASQEEAAVRGMTRNPRMNTGGVKQRADGSIAKWNPKLPDDL